MTRQRLPGSARPDTLDWVRAIASHGGSAIDFELPNELALVQETARAFARDHLRPRDREFESARGVAAHVHRLYRELGLASLELPDTLGGAGLGALARTLVNEELAAADAGAALALDPLGPALYPLVAFGGDTALRTHALPLLERAGSRAVLAFDLLPRLQTLGGRASGILPWVTADHVDLLVVLERERAYVVSEGLHPTPLRGAALRAAGAAELRVDGVARPADWVSTPRARWALSHARLYVASLLVGVMRAAAEFSRSYAMERVAFGRPIAHHQALAFLISDMASAVDGARLLVQEAAWRLDQAADLADEPDIDSEAEVCATAFLEAAEASLFVTPNGVQILGGHGFMQDYPVEKWMREARALSLLLGGIDAAREDAGRALLGDAEPLALDPVSPGSEAGARQ
ncbi:MAG TPA: acyl-CoA dehydrogenase family protein [Myxococcota bacterium]|nr:acyl-CoA dehydrogenase family protein [Myxococcota bacterium]